MALQKSWNLACECRGSFAGAPRLGHRWLKRKETSRRAAARLEAGEGVFGWEGLFQRLKCVLPKER
jgi:hypothetical protein